MKKDRTVPASSGPVLFHLFAGILRGWYHICIGGHYEPRHLLVFGFGMKTVLQFIMLRCVAVVSLYFHAEDSLNHTS